MQDSLRLTNLTILAVLYGSSVGKNALSPNSPIKQASGKDSARSLIERQAKPWLTCPRGLPRAQRVAYSPLMHHAVCREGGRVKDNFSPTIGLKI